MPASSRYFWKYLNRFTPLSKSQTHIKCNFRTKKVEVADGGRKKTFQARSTCKWYIRNFQQFFKCLWFGEWGAWVLAWLPQVNYLSQLDVFEGTSCRFLFLRVGVCFCFPFCFLLFFMKMNFFFMSDLDVTAVQYPLPFCSSNYLESRSIDSAASKRVQYQGKFSSSKPTS